MMNDVQLTVRPMKAEERNYSYTQNQQIMGQTGCIGHLRAWLDLDGSAFPSDWDDHMPSLKTDEFMEEFNWVVDQLRFAPEFGKMLKNRGEMLSYCYTHDEAAFDPGNSRDYGFRADTKDYSYMLRLNPSKGYHNAYIYCYKKDWLDWHMERAESGIRFIDSHYRDLFRLDDGESVRLKFPNGTSDVRACRYIDPTHVQVGSELFHICEFAERMESSKIKAEPANPRLPEQCLTLMPSSGEVISIHRGESGYHKTDITADSPELLRSYVDAVNREKGVTRAQESAMLAGSMFGWGTRGADPRNYDNEGKPIPRKKSQEQAR